MKCSLCHHNCDIPLNGLGFCKARSNIDGKIVDANYGLLTSLCLDPIEKKPLKEFYPGNMILSLGSYGCNLRCPFCQNYEISQRNLAQESHRYSPLEVVDLAIKSRVEGNIGIAFTYNEPLISLEWVKDVASLAKSKGLKTVLVSNGNCSLTALEEILPYIDAMNIDLKGFSEKFYQWISGSFTETKEFIKKASTKTHLEITTLVIPGKNDSPLEMEEEARFLASINPKIPLHLTRYFPQYLCKIPVTPLKTLEELASVAHKYLSSVYLGNI
jgi:pyruvate formate lyase activating enzyme